MTKKDDQNVDNCRGWSTDSFDSSFYFYVVKDYNNFKFLDITILTKNCSCLLAKQFPKKFEKSKWSLFWENKGDNRDIPEYSGGKKGKYLDKTIVSSDFLD